MPPPRVGRGTIRCGDADCCSFLCATIRPTSLPKLLSPSMPPRCAPDRLLPDKQLAVRL
jgi:hypothetical protein